MSVGETGLKSGEDVKLCAGLIIGAVTYDVGRVVCDPALHFLHMSLLAVNGPAPVTDKGVFGRASIKLENYIHHQVDLDLTTEEEMSLLYCPEVLGRGLIVRHLKKKA